MMRRAFGDRPPLGPTTILFMARVASLAAGLVAVIASARLYGADGRGVLAAFAALQFLAATGLALGSGSGAFLAAHRGTSDRREIGAGLLAFAAGLGLLVGTIAAAAWVLGVWDVAVPGTSVAVAVALGAAAAGQYLILGGSQVAMGAASARRTALGWILGPLVVLGSVAIAALAGMAVGELLVVQSSLWLLTGLGFVVAAGAGPPSLEAARGIVSLGRGAALGDLTNALSYRLDVLLVVWLAGSAAAGVYNLATQTMEPLWILATSAAGGLMIGFRGRPEAARAAATVRAGQRVAVLTTIGVVAVVAVLPFVSTLAGPGFGDAVLVGAALGPGIVFLAVARVFAAYQTSLGRLWLGSAIATVAVAIAILGDLIAIPRWGAMGAAAMASVSYGVACLLWLLAFWRVRSPTTDLGVRELDDDPRRVVR